jgi:carbon storage regulator
MLVLSRRKNESIVIGDGIVIRIAEVRGNRVRLAIQAPPGVVILRSELLAVVAASAETKVTEEGNPSAEIGSPKEPVHDPHVSATLPSAGAESTHPIKRPSGIARPLSRRLPRPPR